MLKIAEICPISRFNFDKWSIVQWKGASRVFLWFTPLKCICWLSRVEWMSRWIFCVYVRCVWVREFAFSDLSRVIWLMVGQILTRLPVNNAHRVINYIFIMTITSILISELCFPILSLRIVTATMQLSLLRMLDYGFCRF